MTGLLTWASKKLDCHFLTHKCCCLDMVIEGNSRVFLEGERERERERERGREGERERGREGERERERERERENTGGEIMTMSLSC